MTLDARTAAIKFCTRCGGAMEYREAFGTVRPVCPACGHVHFIDPKVAVCVLVERDGQVLMVRRRSDPERGKWSFPAGFVDAGEAPARAAEREALEETGLRVRVTALLDVIAKNEAVEAADILIVYRAEADDGAPAPGDDADEARYFPRNELPNELAFASTQIVITKWVQSAAS
ncbi:MAG: NUDIX domain-containing protein [Anaerolineales bacterium]|nr:NUDIX domain-containing protein [Anaerolineales bacterium]